MSLKDWQPVDYIVLILTFVIVFFFVSAAIRVMLTGVPLDAEKSKMINHILSGILSTISMFVGYQLKNGKGE